MKRILFTTCLITAMLGILVGCSQVKQPAEVTNSDVVVTENENTNPEAETNNKADVVQSRKIVSEWGTILPAHMTLSLNDAYPHPIHMDLQFPVIREMSSSDIEDKVNAMLFDAALGVFGGNCVSASDFRKAIYDAYKYSQDMPKANDLCGNVDYEVLLFEGNLLSVHFKGDNVAGGMRVNSEEYFVTVDLTSGEYCSLTDFFDENAVANAISEGKFELLEGNYLPGGWDPMGKKDEFIQVFREQVCVNTHSGVGVLEPFEKADFSISYPQLAYYTVPSFGMDAENLYISISYWDSLHGYVILRIPKTELLPSSE